MKMLKMYMTVTSVLRGKREMLYSFQPIDEARARVILSWQYEPPYSFYNVEAEHVEGALPSLVDPGWAYFILWDERDGLVGFCCFGEDARVPGGDYTTPALDIGWGMRPELTGKGRGEGFVKAILGFASEVYLPNLFRVTVATFNIRSQRVCEKVGFKPVQEFIHSSTGEAFVIFLRPA
jgi:RimJ/RimL family protein N-acetyltransferase